ncbi:hypothetical protein AA303_17320 [Pseudomonas psychrophila]|uniref:hypothetical protein n=1 Tax=Pseudomonas psychrophila TaxID=122355 RepID=UPI000629FF2C|nr:hypothetical protein [Pseudomonas psychrophila]KOX63858.1 hypothetical protein AA303_17320 [Pseudomonas psychrophila]
MALKLKKKDSIQDGAKWVDFDADTKVLLAGTDNIEYRVALERHNRRVQRNDARFGEGQVGVVEGELTDLQNHAMLLAHFIVKDWKGVQDDEGCELEYSAGAAAELLESNVEFLLFVLQGGTKVAAEAEQELAETLGKPSTGSSGRKTGRAVKSESSSINA